MSPSKRRSGERRMISPPAPGWEAPQGPERRLPGSKIKFGLKGEGDSVVPDPKEQRTLQRVKALRCEGKTLRGIAKVLNREGRKPRTASVWHPGTWALSSSAWR
jgi:hypothetical protein